jgi:hypothetical protein
MFTGAVLKSKSYLGVMKFGYFCVILVLHLQLLSQCKAQETFTTTEGPTFNQRQDHQVGVGLAITSFSSSFTYFVSGYYAFHCKRHYVAFAPFYGRLDALAQLQDIGFGINYRVYPFKNLSKVRYYAPTGAHYTYTLYKGIRKHGMFYSVGVGSETDLGKHVLLSIDANFALGQTLTVFGADQEAAFGSKDQLNYYFLPRIQLSYRF